MPEVCRFYGIVIKMYIREHAPPHFHAEYGEFAMSFRIDTLEAYAGRLPGRAHGLVREWAATNQASLLHNWTRLREGRPTIVIEPLP